MSWCKSREALQTSPKNTSLCNFSRAAQEAARGGGSEDKVFWMEGGMQLSRGYEPCAGQQGTMGAAAPEPFCKPPCTAATEVVTGCHSDIHRTELRAFLLVRF